MRTVYSALLYAVAGLDTEVILSPPSEFLTVLRCFDVYWGGGPSGAPSSRLIGSAGQTIVEFHMPAGSPPAEALDSHVWSWRGRHVIPAGETYAVSVAGPPADVTLSGYHLRAS